MKKRQIALATLALVLTGLLVAFSAGCGGSEASTTTAAAGDTTTSTAVTTTDTTADNRELHIYGWRGEIPQEIVDGFQAATGIETTFDAFDSNESLVAKLQSGATGYDIVNPSGYAVQQLAQLDLILALDHSKLVGLDNISPKFREVVYDPGNKYALPWVWGTTGLAYNDEFIKEPIEGWSDLWNPAYSGHIVMLDNMLAAYIAALQLNGFSINTNNPEEIAKATESLSEQKALLLSYNSTNQGQLLTQGQAWIVQAWSSSITSVAADNPNIHYVLPKEGGSFWVDSLAIVKSSENVESAYAFMNYILQPEVAAQITDLSKMATTNQAAIPFVDEKYRNDPSIFVPVDRLSNAEMLLDSSAQTQLVQADWTKVRAQ